MYESSQAWNDLMVMSMNLITHFDYYWLIDNILYTCFYVQTIIIALKNTYTFYYSQLSFMKCVYQQQLIAQQRTLFYRACINLWANPFINIDI